MSRYPLVSIALWLASIVGAAAVAWRLRAVRSGCLRALRLSLWIQVAAESAGFASVAFGAPWAYYREYMFGQAVELAAQGILLWGVWASLRPQIGSTRLRAATLSLIVLLSLLSATEFSARVPAPSLKAMVLVTHTAGYIFCAVVFAMTMTAWAVGCAWEPAAARCLIGYGITAAATFGIEQIEAVVGWSHWYLYCAPQIFYLVALLTWSSALSLDQPFALSPSEAASLKRQLASVLEISPVPGENRD